MTDLRAAAQQALEALEAGVIFKLGWVPDCEDAITVLRAALAEPVQEPYTGDVTRIIREAGMTFHLGLPHKPVIKQMSRVVDLVYAEASIKAAQQFAAPPQRKPLTDEEISKVAAPFYGVQGFRVEAFARAIEAAHGIKE